MFTETPNNYQSLYDEQQYRLETASASTFLIRITDYESGELLGVKKFYSTDDLLINISPIIRPYAIPQTPQQTTTFESAERYGYAIVDLAAISDEGTIYTSGSRIFTISRGDESATGPVTTLSLQRLISVGEADSLTIRCAANVTVRADVNYYSVEEDDEATETLILSSSYTATPDASGILTLHLLAKEIDQATKIKVTFWQSDENIAQYDYYIVERAADANRIAWISSRGSIEHYTFAETEAHKESAEGDEWSLVSAFETYATRSAIAEMIFSPKIWIEAVGEGYRQGYMVSEYIDSAPLDSIATLSVVVGASR